MQTLPVDPDRNPVQSCKLCSLISSIVFRYSSSFFELQNTSPSMLWRGRSSLVLTDYLSCANSAPEFRCTFTGSVIKCGDSEEPAHTEFFNIKRNQSS